MEQTTATPASLEDLLVRLQRWAALAPTAESQRPPIRPWQSLRGLFLLNLAGLTAAVLIGAIGIGLWHRDSSRGATGANRPSALTYHTGDAVVSGTVVAVAPPLPGTVTAVFARLGSSVRPGDLIATVKTVPGVIMHVKSPIAGTIVAETATPAEVVGAGTPLAQVIDLDNLYITAFVEEGHIADILVHAPVDIGIAADPGVTYHGRVAQILPVITSTSGPKLGVHDDDSNLTGAGRLVPVHITLDREAGGHLFPGGSAIVTIHTR